MSVCRYFITAGGCSRGDSCSFKHPIDAAPSFPCKYFLAGKCRNGKSCRFQHTKLIDGEHDDKAPSIQSNELNVRQLSGALVTFSDGAVVKNIETAKAKPTRFQTCDVLVCWFQPSKIATLHFRSLRSMNRAVEKLEGVRILERKIQTRTSVIKTTKPWKCLVKVGNLDVDTTENDIRIVLGAGSPRFISFKPSDEPSAEERGQEIQRMIRSRRELVAWTQRLNQRGSICSAKATFGTFADAKHIVDTFNPNRQKKLSHQVYVRFSHLIRVKVSIPSAIYSVFMDRLEELTENIPTKRALPKWSRFVITHVPGSTPEEVVHRRKNFLQMFQGHAMRNAKGILWHPFFAERDGLSLVNQIAKDHNIVIQRDTRQRMLMMYGNPEAKVRAELILLRVVEYLESSGQVFELDERMSESKIHRLHRRMAIILGQKSVELSSNTLPRTITVRGTPDKCHRAGEIFKNSVRQSSNAESAVSSEEYCAVCYCGLSGKTFMTHCRHMYNTICFALQCENAVHQGFPVRCLGDDGNCKEPITLAELEHALTREQFQKLLVASFRYHVRINHETFFYCPTISCDTIFRKTQEEENITCPTCITIVCTKCGKHHHKGLTCEENYGLTVDEANLKRWAKKVGAIECPRCKNVIEKNGGCRHMVCLLCQVHFCWECLKVFSSEDTTYEHLNNVHGGVYGDDVVRAVEANANYRRNLRDMEAVELAVHARANWNGRVDPLRAHPPR